MLIMQSQISFLNRIKLVKEKFYKTYDDDEIKSHLFSPFYEPEHLVLHNLMVQCMIRQQTPRLIDTVISVAPLITRSDCSRWNCMFDLTDCYARCLYCHSIKGTFDMLDKYVNHYTVEP